MLLCVPILQLQLDAHEIKPSLLQSNHLQESSIRYLSLRVVRPRDIEPAHLVLKRSAFQTEAFCRAARAGKFA